ncbi:MAG: HD domain-containing protein [Bacteroidetes bacterium]|nr:HD domain-containing protein [Bacteroidota bacterium]
MEDLIYNIEQKWLKTLFKVCRNTFSDSFLPSHDETHHYRVWTIAIELIRELGTQDIHFSETDIEKILIAVFFHDIGMAKNLDKEHGKISRNICENFFEINPGKKIRGLNEVYETIEKHDNKEYKNNIQFPMKPTNLFFILSVSDDLDAFGIIGIYRYAEIFLMRNININDLPEKVLDNLNSRFDYFQKNYGFLVRFAEKQKARYLTIKSFYEALQKQLTDKPGTSSVQYGPLGVITNIIQFVLERKLSPDVISEHIMKNVDDLFIREFFKQFNLEILSTHPRNNHLLQCYFTKKSKSNSSSM